MIILVDAKKQLRQFNIVIKKWAKHLAYLEQTLKKTLKLTYQNPKADILKMGKVSLINVKNKTRLSTATEAAS